ncbi:hypothetical protein C0991_008011 [Blastosporella zonata]|nr:hypothetical protein C0991_008011 [Blastosporella zonata]
MDGVGHRPGWAWIFILEGLFTFLFGLSSFFILPSSPSEASFLSKEEKEYVETQLRETGATGRDENWDSFSWKEFKETFTIPHMWLISLTYLFNGTQIYGLAYFTPSVVKSLGYTAAQAQLFSVPPFAAAFVVTILGAYFSDRYGARGGVIIFSAILSIVGYSMFLVSPSMNVKWGSLFLTISGAYTTNPTLATWNANNTAAYTRRATSIAFAVGTTNFGGIFATWLFGTLSTAPLYRNATITLLAFSVMIIFTTATTIVYLNAQNRRKALVRETSSIEDEKPASIFEAIALTELQYPAPASPASYCQVYMPSSVGTTLKGMRLSFKKKLLHKFKSTVGMGLVGNVQGDLATHEESYLSLIEYDAVAVASVSATSDDTSWVHPKDSDAPTESTSDTVSSASLVNLLGSHGEDIKHEKQLQRTTRIQVSKKKDPIHVDIPTRLIYDGVDTDGTPMAVTTSATGKGVHIRWNTSYSELEEKLVTTTPASRKRTCPTDDNGKEAFIRCTRARCSAPVAPCAIVTPTQATGGLIYSSADPSGQPIVVSTSATGQGTHTRWLYPSVEQKKKKVTIILPDKSLKRSRAADDEDGPARRTRSRSSASLSSVSSDSESSSNASLVNITHCGISCTRDGYAPSPPPRHAVLGRKRVDAS